MKRTLAVGTVSAVLAVAIFGFLAVRGASGDRHASCIGSVVNGTACPESGNPFEYISFHFGALTGALLGSLTNPMGFAGIAALYLFVAGIFGAPFRSPRQGALLGGLIPAVLALRQAPVTLARAQTPFREWHKSSAHSGAPPRA